MKENLPGYRAHTWTDHNFLKLSGTNLSEGQIHNPLDVIKGYILGRMEYWKMLLIEMYI
jgi:hypothetical protein